MNVKDMSTHDLEALQFEIEDELEKRQLRDSIPEQMNTLNAQMLAATGVREGEPWRQPTGAHDAYPLDWTVEHNGQTWTSLVSGNVWEPGVSGWRAEVGEDEGPAEWVQPTGAHDAYGVGDQVTHDGQVWESNLDGNIWRPGEYGWDAV